METKGRLANVAVDFRTSKRLLTFEVDNVSDEELNRLISLPRLKIKAVRYQKSRSKDANAYHWALVGKIAQAIGKGMQETHKALMLDYGSIGITDGVADYRIVPLGYEPKDTEYWIRGGSVHLAEKKTGRQVEHALYWVVKESHTYDSSEMSALIEGTIAEAKELGIETLPPDEIRRMEEKWESMTLAKKPKEQ